MLRWCAFRTIEGEADGAVEYNAYNVTRKPNAPLDSLFKYVRSKWWAAPIAHVGKSLVFPGVLPSSWHLDFDERCDISAHFT